MERLTHKARYEAGYKLNKGVHEWQAADRLAAYENTGLTPEEIESLNTFDGSQAVKATILLQEEQNKHHWIPVAERLPEDSNEVLVTDRYGERRIAYLSNEGWHLALTGCIYARAPIAWMPLPEPYKSEI